jgi:hypothetical protein
MTKVEKNEQTAKACLFVFRRLEGFILNFKLLDFCRQDGNSQPVSMDNIQR